MSAHVVPFPGRIHLSAADREVLVLTHLPLVRRIARWVLAGRPSHVERDDLESAGMVGLLEAARRYDGRASVTFRTFAESRIRGAMIDEMRRFAPLRRMEYLRSQEMDAAFIPPRVVFNSAFVDVLANERGHVDVRPDYFLTARVQAALARLPRREARVLAWRYWEGLTQAQVAARLGLTSATGSRVSQLEARALRRLRGALIDLGVVPPRDHEVGRDPMTRTGLHGR